MTRQCACWCSICSESWVIRPTKPKTRKTALPLLESDLRVDLLVTDVGLPGMNGRQLAEIARQHRPGLRVLFMTGYAQKAAERQGFLEDGMDMVAKPFAIELLASKIRTMISQTP
jgi:CheY-like chemotaxis protein